MGRGGPSTAASGARSGWSCRASSRSRAGVGREFRRTAAKGPSSSPPLPPPPPPPPPTALDNSQLPGQPYCLPGRLAEDASSLAAAGRLDDRLPPPSEPSSLVNQLAALPTRQPTRHPREQRGPAFGPRPRSPLAPPPHIFPLPISFSLALPQSSQQQLGKPAGGGVAVVDRPLHRLTNQAPNQHCHGPKIFTRPLKLSTCSHCASSCLPACTCDTGYASWGEQTRFTAIFLLSSLPPAFTPAWTPTAGEAWLPRFLSAPEMVSTWPVLAKYMSLP